MGLLRRTPRGTPPDPLAPILARTITTARPVTGIPSVVPGFWLGDGCHLAGLRVGEPANNGDLETMVAEGGAFDIVLAEPIELLRWLAVYGPDRAETWLGRFGEVLAAALPAALADVFAEYRIGLKTDDLLFVAGVYIHPVVECWPTDADVWHAHCIVPAKVWCTSAH